MTPHTTSENERRHITWHQSAVSREERQKLLHQQGAVLWMTGLSGSGKSTVATALDKALTGSGHLSYILDGDNIRHGLNADLAFSPAERTENIRRVGEVAALFADAGLLVITAFISPYRKDRRQVRSIVGEKNFIEIHLDVPLEVCEKRDPKSLYKKARAGEISDFTGIQAPYEAPANAELTLDTSRHPVHDCVQQILDHLIKNNILFGKG